MEADQQGFLPSNISKKQASDTGMAMVLILLLLGFFFEDQTFYIWAIPALVINMVFPMFYYPLAFIWLGFAHLLGMIVSRVILTIIYFILVFPVGLFRRLLGKDILQLSGFKKSKTSVMVTRNHIFESTDVEKPY